MRFLIKKSVAKEILKSLGKNKLEELKQEVIEILKKQDEKEYKKALSHFENEEKNMSYLEKSISGEWVEKAGYGIGTVRVWQGKKYKKIAPGKWARMYEKEGRGTNIAVGHLIAKVKKIDDIEELMNFVMQNKQRFQDENEMDLPILDKIRAAVDEQNEKLSSGTVESKGKFENIEKREYEYYKHNLSEKDDLETILKDIKEEREYYNKHKDVKGAEKRLKELSAKEKVVNELLENTENKEKKDETKFPEKEIYNTNKEVKELLMNTDSDSSSFKLSDIYDRNTHDEMKKVQSFDEAKNVIKQIADNYGATEKGRKLLENFMSYNVGGSSPIYDKVYEHFGISYNDLDADFDAAKNKILKLASGQKNVSKEDKKIQQGKDDFASKYRAAIEQEDKNFQKNEKSKKAKIKKSLEDILFLLNEDEEEEDYNDYSAENPELFNSVAYRVANAFEECGY